MRLAEAFAGSPELYPLSLSADGREARLLRLSEADYTAASFLDERLLVGPHEAVSAPWDEVRLAAATLPLAADFIFHIGHVGSTLLSRLLGVDARTFSLREPALLRRLAVSPTEASERLDPLLRAYSRTWRPGQRALVKATSFVSALANDILSAVTSARAVLMLVAPEIYIAGSLGGEATRAQLPALTPDRLGRLKLRLQESAIAPVRGEGEMAAAAWACEARALADCAVAFPDRTLWLDFDRFLIGPRDELARVLQFMHGEADPRALGAMLSSPDMNRYSKAPEHPFSAGLRGQVLRQARDAHGAEITRGVAWLETLARTHPLIRDAVHMAAVEAERVSP